ncbi:hypothetical protein DFH11DRAFT_1731823 [Phellopilus nigrolimitatus]|nr:hypothetical protein DFH11DRAFT_1731823 [Phellopilus nigrolimitatus]
MSDTSTEYGDYDERPVRTKRPGATQTQLEFIRTAVAAVIPSYCTGTVSTSANDLILFYGKSEDARRLDFLNLSETSLSHLAQTCDPEGKLGKGHFAPLLDIERLGLVKSVREDLLEGFNSQRPIKAELSQLSIYGKGMLNMPRSESTARKSSGPFGHLMVVLPSEHEGAQLIFRTKGREHVFDAAKAIQEHTDQPTSENAACVAYASFYCDVEVEVSPVSTGHHVALTYDLFFDDMEDARSLRKKEEARNEIFLSMYRGSAAVDLRKEEDAKKAKNVMDLELGCTPSPGELMLKTALATLLADPEFLPQGGYIGFGLRRQYPVKQLDLVLKDMRASGIYGTIGDPDSETEAETAETYDETQEDMLDWDPETDTKNWNPSAVANVLTSLDLLEANLRGADAALLRACRALSLCTVVRMVYTDLHTNKSVLIDDVLEYVTDFLQTEYRGTFLRYLRGKIWPSKRKGLAIGKDIDVRWATRLSYCNELDAAYTFGGDRPKDTEFYDDTRGRPCIILQVGPAGMRASEKFSVPR